jgi:hypothetical protein
MRTMLALALILTACSKKTESPPTPAKEEAKPAPKPAEPPPVAKPAEPKPAETKPADSKFAGDQKPAASGDCPAGTWTNEAKDQPRFCLTLPKDFALKGSPEKKNHYEYHYTFTAPGDHRARLSVVVQGFAKPAVTNGMSSFGPMDDWKKVTDEAVPNGRRLVSRAPDYDKEEFAAEDELVVLSKGESVDIKSVCSACPPWEWIVRCTSSVRKAAPAGDRSACRSLLMP